MKIIVNIKCRGYIIKIHINQMKNINKNVEHEITEAEILKKIQKSSITSAEQFEMIIQNLEEQSRRLIKDRQQLKSKVEILQLKHNQMIAQEKLIKKSGDPKKYYNKLKRELESSYKELESYQKRVYNSMNKNAINIQLRQLVNKFFAIQQEIKEIRSEIIDEKKVFQQLQKAIKTQMKHLTKNQPQCQALEEQNKELKKKIYSMRIEDDLAQHLQIRVQDNMVLLKEKKKFYEKLNTLTVEEVKKLEMQPKLDILKQSRSRVSTNKSRRLKTQFLAGNINRYHTQSAQSKLIIDEPKKSVIEIKEQKLSEAKQRKNCLQEELNSLEITLNELEKTRSQIKITYFKQEQRKEQKNRKLQIELEKQYVEVSLQVNQEYEDLDPLRLDLVGKASQGDYLNNDRMLLKDEKNTLITALMTFQNKFGIVCIRASYSIGKITPIYEKIGEKYLKQKCKMRKIILSDPKDYLKWFKIFYNTELQRVIRMEVFSNNKIKFQAGKTQQQMFGETGIIAYKIDNLASEAPCCLRTSYKEVKGKDWVLSQLGFEINTL